MNKEPKAAANWYIASTHYVTAGLAVPFAVSLIAAFLLTNLIPENILFIEGIITPLNLVSIWFGTIYSARFIKRTYIIPDSRKIVTLSVTYFVVVGILSMVAFLYIPQDPIIIAANACNVVLGSIVFYVASKKYIYT
jgi:lipid-A-disaccharide synthase-like uncharacterized protein